MYYVLYSADPYLLARMATDLQMEGFQIFDQGFCPFDTLNCNNLAFEVDTNFMVFMVSRSIPIWRTLTPRNYLRVLGEIVNSKL